MRKYLLLIGLVACCLNAVNAEIRLPKLVSNGMVLQHNSDINIWGWSSPHESVEVTIDGTKYNTKSDAHGKWLVKLAKHNIGGPYTMDIIGENKITIQDIYFGDVWLCSGQSNMELQMYRVEPLYRNEMETINNQTIRIFKVAHQYDFNHEKEDVKAGEWQAATPENIRNLSAVSYFFAEAIQQYNNIPIGIINCSMGGSPVEAWLSEDAIGDFEESYLELMKHKDKAFVIYKIKRDQARHNEWFKTLDEAEKKIGCSAWKSPEFDHSSWSITSIPSLWNTGELKDYHGSVWYRKTIDVPQSMINKPAHLELGCIIDSDSVFINGEFVGNTTYKYPPRWYKIDKNILKQGKNTITIKLISERGQGGFVEDKPYEITTDTDTISLKGNWNFRTAAEKEMLEQKEFIRWKPCGLYNGMLHPLQNYTIKGALWYQGESNTQEADQYEPRLTSMINDWRSAWGQGDFPFLIVQLANYMDEQVEPSESDWAVLRNAQYNVSLSVPNTGFVQASDLGIWNDIHPMNKKHVGIRAALTAKKLVYEDEEVIHMGPCLDQIKKKGSKLELSFTNIGSGLMIRGENNLNGFAIAGEDGQYYWAKAKLKDNRVILNSPSVKDPTQIKFAWEDNPAKANLYNIEGFPAVPFKRTIE